MKSPTLSKEKLSELLRKMREEKASKEEAGRIPGDDCGTSAGNSKQTSSVGTNLPEDQQVQLTGTGRTGEAIVYNKEQAEFIKLASSGKSAVLIGAAGTGKTTCMQGAILALEQSGMIPVIPDSDTHKYLPTRTPGIVVIAYTRRAVNNIRKVMPEHMKGNCITHHKLLEYEPIWDEITDPNTGDTKRTMRFEATRNRFHPLSSAIHTVIIEESSMYSVELENELKQALRHPVQFIYLGDIQQLPPVFGSAVLGYKMLELPVVELTEVYRQALESPIIRLAHRILSGRAIPSSEYGEWKFPGQLTIHPWKKKLKWEDGLITVAKFFTTAYDNEIYNAEEDIILCPFNKSFGTDELNKYIANHIARKEGKTVWEVRAGIQKQYFYEGLKVLYDKEDAIVTKIEKNRTYHGKRTQKESLTLDFWGHNPEEMDDVDSDSDSIDDVDILLEDFSDGDEDSVRAASHKITIELVDSKRVLELDSAGAINGMILGYCLTVHKSQGSEWRKVFFVLHNSHAVMVQRELLYTGCTRAKQELYVICEPESFTKGILNQRIKGDTLQAKAEFFKGKLEQKKQLEN